MGTSLILIAIIVTSIIIIIFLSIGGEPKFPTDLKD